MANRKPLYLDADGFPTEMSTLTDSMTLDALTVQGAAGITLVSGTVTGLPTPSAASDAAPKSYVDSVAQGLTPKQAVRVATTADLGATYNASGGAGGTGQFTGAPTTLDGVTLAAGDRILVKDQGGVASHLQNGIYSVTAATSTWDRASDFDEDAEALAGSAVWVTEGTVSADSLWVVVTDNPITLNTTAIEWSNMGGVGDITAGTGLTKTLPNTLDVIGGAGLIANADDVGVELDTAADAQGAGADGGSSGLEFDQTGLAGKLRVRVNGSGGIQRGASGLELELDNTPNTLSLSAAGLAVSGLPSLFSINDVAVSANVTAANLTELTGGGTTTLHSHTGAAEAQRIENTYTTDGTGVAIGDPVYFSGNAIVSSADASTSSANGIIGLAKTTVGASSAVDVVSDGRLNGVLTGATAGAHVYLAPGGGLTFTRPTGVGRRVVHVGHAVNATDLHVEITFRGRAAIS